MKLKNRYVLRTVAYRTVAIAIDQGSEKADGVITLNSTGAIIFDIVNKDLSVEEIVEKFFNEYEVSKEEAENAVTTFIENLKASGLAED
jgi:hypothetical protein